MIKTNYFSIALKENKLVFLDQTKLPLFEEYVETDDYERIALAIERLEVRGAPAIGVTAAYALALSVKFNGNNEELFYKAYHRLASTRPTAVNLFMGLDYIKNAFLQNKESGNLFNILIEKAVTLHNEDAEMCRKIGDNGAKLFRKKSNVLTHCNTGILATAGEGTAFSVIKTAFERGLVNMVYADETRPLQQGLRLTAFELDKNGIPFMLQSDSSAAVLMQQEKIDLVITGADRIALNGDSANKVGTYNLAVLCNYHSIPFYIAAPSTTIDKTIATGNEIEIEYRSKFELLNVNGNKVAPEHYEAFTPAFDVTPSHLISGIITEETVYFFPYNFLYK